MYHIDPNSSQTNEHNQVLYFSHFPFRSLAKVTNVPCADGKNRVARITGEPDTYFSVPARVHVGAKTVTGFVYVHSSGEYRFTANRFGKNFDAIGPWGE